MKKILCLFATFIVAIGLTSCGTYGKYIEEIKTGYIGGCLDVTIDEVFSQTIPNGKWDSKEMDDGKIIVEYKSKAEDNEASIQFIVTDENHFNISSVIIDGAIQTTDEESVSLIESRYIQYYGNKYPNKAAADCMPKEPKTNLLNGISAAEAERAKNPIDIVNYLDKTNEEVKNALSIEETEEVLKKSEISIKYNTENSRIDTAIVSGSRVYSLFGVQTYQTLETALGKIADRFEKTSEQDNGDGTSTVTLIRNNSEDSMTIKYDTATASVTEITYTYNGLEGYRAEQERLKKEAEEKAAAEAAAKAKADILAKSKVKTASDAISAVKIDFGNQDAVEHFDYWYDDYSDFRAEDCGDYYKVYGTFDASGITRYRTYKVDKLTGTITYLD